MFGHRHSPRILRFSTTVAVAILTLLPLAAEGQSRLSQATGQQGMVVTVSPPATRVGLEILRQGGNAVDAAIAVEFALAVTWPEAGNIGGGGFMMVHPGPSHSGRMPT